MRCALLCMLIVCLVPAVADAAATITIVESGGDVVATLSGSLTVSTLTLSGTSPAFTGHAASGGNLGFGGGTTDFYAIGTTWTPFGTGSFATWSSTTGDAYAMFSSSDFIGVPTGYTDGTSLSATGTATGATFASLGFTTGTFVTTLSNGDTVTVTVVPEPGSFALCAIALLALGLRKRRVNAAG